MTKELLFSVTKKDFEVTWYKSSGSGGQKKNKTVNACRIRHPESGVLVTASERRERTQNQKAAFLRLVNHPKFKSWLRRKIWEVSNKKTLEELVEEDMNPANLKIEIRDNGKWVVAPEKRPC